MPVGIPCSFFTIPVGFLLGGGMVDQVCEPFMAGTGADSLAAMLFGQGKGSGAAMMIFLLGLTGMTVCLVFGKVLKKYRYQERVEGRIKKKLSAHVESVVLLQRKDEQK